MQQTTQKNLSDLDRLKMDIDSPFVFNVDMEYNKLIILTGQNGTGKSYLFKTTYAISSIMNTIIMLNGVISIENLLGLTQYVFDHCFEDQNNNGTIKATYKSGAYIEIEFKIGKVINIDYNINYVTEPTKVVYMSSDFRTFTTIKSYFLLRKALLAADPTLTNETIVHKMTDHYKLYDVMYCEMIYNAMPFEVNNDLSNTLINSFDFSDTLTEINFDEDKCDFYYVTKENPEGKTYMCSLGKGHQSILNMLMGSNLSNL